MNAIGTQLRDPINSGLTRCCMAVLNKKMNAVAELGRTRFSLSMEMSRLMRDSRDQILRRERGQEILFFPVQLTTSRIGNLNRLIHTLAVCVTIISGRNPPILCTLTVWMCASPEAHGMSNVCR